MDPILEIAASRGIAVVEDACQAHGATYKGRRAGTMGVAGCFSFYPGKNLGAYGEAGAVVTGSDELAAKVRVLRDHGQPRKYMHSVVGWNGRMDGIQAAVLSVKLPHLEAANEARRRHARTYRELLASCAGVRLPAEADYGKHVYHVYAVRVANRDAVMQRMQQEGVGCGVHYPVPIHLQEAYRSQGCAEGSFPVAERCAREFLSLPMFPELTGEQVAFTAKALAASVG
jgi:dTDP-4-amino-4,6-dideoxygalactose transaminase